MKRRPPILGLKQQAQVTKQWYRGRLCPNKTKNAWFIKPVVELPNGYDKSKDVFMYPSYISQYVLPVVAGDTLEFILGDRDKTKPMAQKVRVSQYSPRSCEELTGYFRQLMEDLDSVGFQNVLVQVLPCTAMWRFFASPKFTDVQDKRDLGIGYVELFLSLLKLILRHGRPYKTLLEDVLKTITRGTIFLTTTDRSLPKIIKCCSYETTDKFHLEEQGEFLSAELVRSFCRDAARLVPSVTHCLLPTVAAISKKISSPSTQSFLYTLLSLNCAAGNGFTTNAQIWMELPLLPSNDELAGHFVEKDHNLTPVRTHVPYDDPEQYMDTYFRLVRAETFSAIQHGIKDLKASTLDLRDMNVYYNIHLAGFALQSGRFSLAINFTPTKEVKKWEASPQLMFGNLVCLSINRKFDDVIWATVSN